MLTNDDLSKIGTLIDSKLGINNAKLEKHIDEKLDQRLGETLESNNVRLEQRFNTIFDKKLEPIKKSLRKLAKDQKLILDVLDRDIIKVRLRVERIEKHFGFASL